MKQIKKLLRNMEIYCLTETVERDGIRDFSIRMVSHDYQKILDEKEKWVALDPYEDFAAKGMRTNTAMYSESNYDEGFTAYTVTIHDMKIVSPKIFKKLNVVK